MVSQTAYKRDMLISPPHLLSFSTFRKMFVTRHVIGGWKVRKKIHTIRNSLLMKLLWGFIRRQKYFSRCASFRVSTVCRLITCSYQFHDALVTTGAWRPASVNRTVVPVSFMEATIFQFWMLARVAPGEQLTHFRCKSWESNPLLIQSMNNAVPDVELTHRLQLGQ